MVATTMPWTHATIEQRFWKKVYKTSGCWFWIASTDELGYGLFGLGGKLVKRAHVASWMLYNGPIEQGLIVMHKCDTPGCVRPSHLQVGTHKQNTQDAARKGNMGLRSPRRIGNRFKCGHLAIGLNCRQYPIRGVLRKSCRICHNKSCNKKREDN